MSRSRWASCTAGLRRLRPALMIAVAGLLVYQLSEIGWQQIGESIPRSPLFYLLFCVGYCMLPLSELVLYGRAWKFNFRDALPVFFIKRVYNQDVVDYSGDVSVLVWARGRFGWRDADLARVIKDHSLISALAGHAVALIFPMLCFLSSDPATIGHFADYESVGWICGLVVAPLLVLASYLVRRKIFFLPDRELAAAAGIHLTRIMAGYLVVLSQWAVVMPEQPWHVWFILLTMQSVVGRLPTFLGRDFLIVSAGLAASKELGVQAGTAACVLLANGVLEKVVNAGVFLAAAATRSRTGKKPVVDGQDATIELPEPHDDAPSRAA